MVTPACEEVKLDTAARYFDSNCRSTWQNPAVPVSVISSEVEKSLALSAQQLSQHERQNSAVPVVIDLDRRIDAQLQRNRTL